MLENGIHTYKRFIVYILMITLAITIAAMTVSLVWLVLQFILDPNMIIVDKKDLLHFLGFFLLIIIAIELLDTLIIYVKHHVVKVEIVILVAITAAAREIIVQDYEKVQAMLLIGIGGILVAAAMTYYVVRKARIESFKAGMNDEAE